MKKIILSSVLVTSALLANSNTGCGLGTTLFPEQNSVIMQVVASTTNGTSGNQTFGITSGSLGCDKPASFASNIELQNFVADNMEALALDAAMGQGETLNTLAALMNIKDASKFSKLIQLNFDHVFTSVNVSSAQVIDNIANI